VDGNDPVHAHRETVNRRLGVFVGVAGAWNRFWFEPTSTSTVAVVRIAFGVVILGWAVSLAPDLFAFYSDDGILPSQPEDYPGTGAWGLLGIFESDLAVVVVYLLLLLASLAVIVGIQARIASLVLFVCVLSFTRRDPWILNSGDLFLRVLAFYLVFAPTGAALSVDAWRKSREHFWEFPLRAPWALRLIQVQLTILYLAAVWAKARGSLWNDGTAVSYALRIGDLERFPVPDFVTDSLILSNLMTYGTLATELAIPILVWNRRLRPWVLLFGVFLHLGIDYAVRVGFFTLAMLVLYVAFVPPKTMEAWVLSFRERLARPAVGLGPARVASHRSEPDQVPGTVGDNKPRRGSGLEG
jgi:hypothetical protein